MASFGNGSVIRAIEIIAQSKVDSLKLDKTVIALINSIVNLNTGEYKIKYEGNIVSAYADSLPSTYEVGDKVYVKIPLNDMSKRLTIEGLITGNKTVVEIAEEQVAVNQIGPTWDQFYNYDYDAEYGIVAGVIEEDDATFSDVKPYTNYFTQVIYDRSTDAGAGTADNYFLDYSKQSTKVRLSASFMTALSATHTQGNYGIIVRFKINTTDTENNTVAYRLDMNNFTGSPYTYSTWSPQSLLIDVSAGHLTALDSIVFFQESFVKDTMVVGRTTTTDEDGTVTDVTEITQENPYKDDDGNTIISPNLFVKDIELSFVETVDLTQQSYYVTIGTPGGVILESASDELTLEAKLMYQGGNILDESTCLCYWYKLNPAIRAGSDNYDKLAGARWEPVESTTFGKLTIKGTDVPVKLTYKLIVVYNDTQLTKTVDITRMDTRDIYNLEIQQYITDDNEFHLKIAPINRESILAALEEDKAERIAAINANSSLIEAEKEEQLAAIETEYTRLEQMFESDSALLGDWYFYLPDGSYDAVTNGTNTNDIIINSYLTYPTITFYCLVYDNQEMPQPLVVLTSDLKNQLEEEAVSVVWDGYAVYQYDASGDMAYEDTETDRTLSAKVELELGYGTTYTLTWKIGSEEIPSGIENCINPLYSMMQRVWVDTANVLHYNIRLRYDINYTNNIITLVITAPDGSQFSFDKEILFFKDGDLGTNGTTYICAVRPVNIDTSSSGYLTQEIGNHAMVYNNGAWESGVNLRCFVYKEGELINANTEDYSITYTWSVGATDRTCMEFTDINGLTSYEDCRYVIGYGDLTEKKDYIVKVTVKVTPQENAGLETDADTVTVYCSYPVDIAIDDFDYKNATISLPSYIKYTSSGTNPSYQRSDLVCTKEDGTKATEFKSTDEEQAFSIVDNYNKDGYVIKPLSNFISEYGTAAIECYFGNDLQFIHPVVMYLNTYGNENINGWDGNSLVLYEGDGTSSDSAYILAPQVGAGAKDTNGLYSGVIMGKQKLGDSSTVYGLYGYNKGVGSFGFKEDGTAFIGTPGEGLINFDGTKGTIKSATYITSGGKEGMSIDLGEGSIDAYNFKLTSQSIKLDSAKKRFVFTLDDDSSSYFRINSTTAYEDTSTDGGTNTETKTNTLFNVSNSSYYLLTANYNNKTGEEAGTRIDLGNGKITSYDFNIKTPYMELSSSENGTFKFYINKVNSTSDKTNSGVFAIYAGDGTNDLTIFYVSTSNYYLRSKNYSSSSGLYIDLTNGSISSPNFTITSDGSLSVTGSITATTITATSGGNIAGWTIDGSSGFTKTASTSSGSYGLTVGDTLKYGNYFEVATDGTLTCSNANVSGAITATSGKIGSWTITSSGLTYGSTLAITTSSLKYGGNFEVSSSGILTASNAIISGSIIATSLTASKGTIGKWSINDSGLYSGTTIEITPSLINFNDNFIVNSSGAVTIDGYITIKEDKTTRGYLGYYDGSTGSDTTTGISLWSLNEEYGYYNRIITTDGGVRMTCYAALNDGVPIKGEYYALSIYCTPVGPTLCYQGGNENLERWAVRLYAGLFGSVTPGELDCGNKNHYWNGVYAKSYYSEDGNIEVFAKISSLETRVAALEGNS